MSSSLTSWTSQETLVEYLREREVACPQCKGSLRGIAGGQCPTCGAELVLGLTAGASYRRAWGLLVALMSMNGIVGLLALAAFIRFRTLPRAEMVPTFFTFLAAVPLAPLPLVLRGRYLRLSRRAQWTWTAAGVALTLLAFLTTVVAMLRMR